MCNKTSYPSERSAKKARNLYRKQAADMRAYYCEKCRRFHLTTQRFRDPYKGR